MPDTIHVSCMGLDAERMIITLHTDYSSYANFIERLSSNDLLEIDTIRSFIVGLTNE